MSYKYVTKNNLYEKQTYMYSEYEGMQFIKEYLNVRNSCLDKPESGTDHTYVYKIDETNSPVRRGLKELYCKLENGECSDDIINVLNAYTKSFEVRKRIYDAYDQNWKPLSDAGFEDYINYMLLAECLIQAYKYTNILKYFSCLLKVDDTLISVKDQLVGQEKDYLCTIIREELGIFYQLAERVIGQEAL